MKDSQGREISISRLDMLTDDEVAQLKDDSWDDYCWKSGNQYARMVHEFCVIEQDKRIRQAEADRIECERIHAQMESEARVWELRSEINQKIVEGILGEKTKEEPKEEPKRNLAEFGPSGERLRGKMRELLTGTE